VANFLMPGDPFYKSKRWKDLVRFMNKNWQARMLPCGWCGEPIGKRDRTIVDHIHPRHTHPQLQWSISNLQVLHHRCNTLKGIADRKEITPTGEDGFPPGWG
jgi:5-methylcytosine-specific restriction endonuclease McrA